jgi:UDP-GlcNAc:undecaprenyl-phosphate/decaprenyl-phosphate GlcNAc-1-phosphate transferase
VVWHELTGHLEVLWASLIALGIVVLLTPAVGGMARLLGVVDRPENGRRQTPTGIPRLGGLALFLGIFVPALAFLNLDDQMRGLLLGAAVATTVGAIDDFRGLRAWEKLAGQVLAAAIVVYFGVWVHRFTFPILGVQTLPREVGMVLTVIGIVAVMNMVNFLDGLDGLAAGVCAISAFSFCVIDLARGDINAAILTAAVLGGCIGFLRHNFYPARIFMGDSGALLLGFTLAAVSVQGLSKTAALAALVLPLLVLAVPLLDTSFVVAKRIKSGRPIYVADKSHLHHRFENIGFSQRRSVIYLYIWCGTLALAALATKFVHPHPGGDWNLPAVAIDSAIGLLAIGTSIYVVYLLEIVKPANPFIRRREEATRDEARKSA